MNKSLIFAMLLGFVVLAMAQASNYSLQSLQGPLTSCQVPVLGSNTLCSGPDGWYVASGSGTLTKIGAGIVGPAGPTGPIGLTGPQGPAGATGTIPPTFSCIATIPVAGGPVVFSSCH